MAPRPEMREAHREQKILMASAAEEVSRIAGEARDGESGHCAAASEGQLGVGQIT